MDSVAAIIWLIAGGLLAAAEALTGDFFLLMIAGGALATAGISAVTDFPASAAAISAEMTADCLPPRLRTFRCGQMQ